MLKNIALLLFVTLLLFECNSNPSKSKPVEKIDFDIHTQTRILKVQESTTLELILMDTTLSDYQINWTTNSGQIFNENGITQYIAPNIVGNSQIVAEIIDNENNSFYDTVEVMVYKQLVFLKADDIRYHSYWNISPKWIRFFDYIKEKNIKANLGLIGNSLEEGDDIYCSSLMEINEYENFEFWNHGFTHKLNGTNDEGEKYHEFWNTSYEEQKQHLLKTQDLAKEKLGITLHGFGAPGNNIDDNTVAALEEIPDIKFWYYGNENSNKLVFPRRIRVETSTGVADYDKFIADSRVNDDILTLEIHPACWDDPNRYEEFKKVIDYLMAKDVTFMTGYEYYKMIHPDDY